MVVVFVIVMLALWIAHSKRYFKVARFTPLPQLVDIAYNTSGSNTNRSVFVLPRRAYVDNRTVRGNSQNVVVILAEIHDDALLQESIVACEMNGAYCVISEQSFTGWVREHHGGTHRAVLVECEGFNISSTDDINGSQTHLIYKRIGDCYYSRVKTEMPLFIQNKTMKKSGSVFACATVFNQPERLHDWLRYQKTLGVDFVHFSVHASFSSIAEKKYPVLNESLHNGFVQMDVWEDIVGERIFYHSQITKYQDCLYRYMGVYEFGIFYDVDDFFNPMLPDHKDIHYYMNREFANPKIGSVCFAWANMDCKPIPELHKALLDGNLTKTLQKMDHKFNSVAKCAHRLNAAVMVTIHDVERLLDEYKKAGKVNRTLAYIAHNHVYPSKGNY